MKRARSADDKGPTRFRAEVWDQMQFFFQEYNDHMLHAVVYLRGFLDRESIRKAVLLSMETLPLLGARFVLDRSQPYWEKMDPSQDGKVISFVDCANPEGEIDRFITGKTDELEGPQIMARVIRSGSTDTLCIVMNHMVCDGAGFKEYLYLLAALYNQIEAGEAAPPGYRDKSRDSKQIYRHIGLLDRIKAFFLRSEYRGDHRVFPLSEERSGWAPFILRRTLSQDRFHGLKAFARQHDATVNDVVFAAYFRALRETLDLKEGETLTVPCMVDLRRYLPGKKAEGFCNLTSNIICTIGPDIGSTLGETVMRVSAEMKALKGRYPGLAGLSTLYTLFRFVPFARLRRLMKERFRNPLIGITNIGVIDPERLVFGKTPVEDAFVTGSIKYPPYFQLALTSFNDKVTFTIAEYGSEKDREAIGRFLDRLDKEFEAIP